MPIPRSVHPPPFDTTRASHVVLTVRDLSVSRAFYCDALGFAVSDADQGALYLRGIEEAAHHSLVLRLAREAPVCQRIGLRVYTEDDLDRARHYFQKAQLPAAFVEAPHQGRTLHVRDAVGTPLEFCASMEVKPRLVVQFREHRAACPQRIDHFQVLSPDVETACAFYCGLGFRLSEFIAPDGTDDLMFVFLQRKGNPHDIVFAHGAGPRLHHAAFSVPDAAHIVQACDMAGAFGFGANLEYGPGRHGPGHALFAYFRDPDGHRIELFNTHYQVMDIENEPVRWDLSSLRRRSWGLPPRRRWYLEASRFAETEPREPARKGDPMTLEKFLAEEG